MKYDDAAFPQECAVPDFSAVGPERPGWDSMVDRRTSQDESRERRAMNRRAFPRWPAQFEARFEFEGSTVSATPIEISEGGMSLEASRLPAVSGEVDLEYRLQNNPWVKVRARVTHSNGQRAGFEFLRLRREDRLRIVDYIAAQSRPS